MNRVFDLHRPERVSTSIIFASPHSGREYSKAFLDRSELDARTIRSSEDAFVDRLFSAAPDHGAPLLAARVPRAWLDLNRGEDEFDPALIEGVRRRGYNPRIASGLGVIPRVVANGRTIYQGKLTLAEAEERIEQAWRPYHAALRDLIAEAKTTFDEAILLDCHSMPREAVDGLSLNAVRRPDVVLGDRFGASASPAIVARIEAALQSAGLRVVRNAPFAGAYVAQHYGRPSRQVHAVQIEIDRSLYMDERRIEPRPDFEEFRKLMSSVVAQLTEIGRPDSEAVAPLAAE